MLRRYLQTIYLVWIFANPLGSAFAQTVPGAVDRYFTTSDGVRLHYLEAGPVLARDLVFIPGWALPAWIFTPQIEAFSHNYHVIAFDPRGQGESQVAPQGYNQTRRGEDIGELLEHLGPRPVVVIGWSLGVLDTLAYIHTAGDAKIAGLVLIDNSVGENPPPKPQLYRPERVLSRPLYMHAFVAGMFQTAQSPAYLNALTTAALRLPEKDAKALLEYPVPRSYWREAIFSTHKPVLYVVRPRLSGQAENLLADRPNTEIAIYPDVGHALFVDAAPQFNLLLAHFLAGNIWPPTPQIPSAALGKTAP